MKKYFLKVFVLFSILLINIKCYTQTDGPKNTFPDMLTYPGWEYYSDNMLSTISAGKGNTGIAGLGDLSLLTLNSAAININKKYQVFVGSSYKSNIALRYSYSTNLKNLFPSGIIGGMYRINKNFQAGIVYRNDYGFLNDLNYYSNSQQDFSEKFVSHNLSVPVTFNYNWLRLGVNLNLTNFRGGFNGYITTELNPEGEYGESYSSLWRFVPQFGLQINPIKEFSFGLTYTPGFSDSTTWYYNVSNLSDVKSFVKFPWRLGIGTELKLINEKLKLSLDYHFDKTSSVYNLKDKSNFNFGIEYRTEDYLILRGGFFTLFDFKDYKNTIFTEDELKYDQYFLTLGGTYKYKGFSFSLALMDSHLTSKSDVYHTKINGGVCLDF